MGLNTRGLKRGGLILTIASRLFSSWSLRADLILHYSGQVYETHDLLMGDPDFYQKLATFSPALQVPALRDGDLNLSDSLAIGEYMAELEPDLWPHSRNERAVARMVACYIHSGVKALRGECPMNLSIRHHNFKVSDAVKTDLEGLERIAAPLLSGWDHNHVGLCGKCGIIDAFLTPIAGRVDTYNLPVSTEFRNYLDGLLQQSEIKAWIKQGKQEYEQLPPSANYSMNDANPLHKIGDYPLLAEH